MFTAGIREVSVMKLCSQQEETRMSNEFLELFITASVGVSCHCGLQSTVVHSRVRQLKLLDLQRNGS
ncbi:hypothetical protein JOQ06_022923 [Pogonophryne albipinna]|uniref:Uncharacterized protein n=1 Tax=Pogonophryne albipinna TaxID=1090488 RepID=A0AAD6ACU5_9TELE|nr:hypothetical protein JOQ06_022923 [Pogonophryne albipinna]